jgi:phage terminase large subunit GpA-like protein
MNAMAPRKIEGLAHGAAVVFSAFAAARPGEELDVAQWADKYRMISGESGSPHAGPWRTDRTPYLREIMECAGVDHPSARVAVRASAQVGKSQFLLNAAFHCIDTAPRSIMVAAPSYSKAQAWNREQWEPSVEATEKIRLKVLATKSRSGEDSTTFHKRFRGGFLKIVSAGTAKELQSSTIGLMIYEEITDFDLDVGGRGDPVDQLRARLFAWGDEAKELAASTPGEKGKCRISNMVEAGDFRLYFVPCPHCGDYFTFDIVDLDEEDGRAVFNAPCCGVAIGEQHKAAMLAGGHWLKCFEAEDPDADPAPNRRGISQAELERFKKRGSAGRQPSFHLWQAYSPFRSWQLILADWRLAREHPEKLRVFSQQVLGEPFEAAHDRPKAEALQEANRSANAVRFGKVERGQIPAWACVLVGSADVQGDRIEWAAYAYGPGRRRARIDRGVIPIHPSDPRAWIELGRIASQSYEGEVCGPVRYDRFGVDTGGHYTQEAYRFALRAGILALKGKPNDPDALPLTLGSRVRVKGENGKRMGRVPLHLVGTFNLKKGVYHGFQRTLDFAEDEHATGLPPGIILFESDATAEDFKQATAEALFEDVVKGRRVAYWDRQPKNAPNEQLDLLVYADSLAVAFGVDRLSAEGWQELFAARAKDPALAGAGPLEQLMTGLPEPARAAPRGKPDWAKKLAALNAKGNA